MIKCLVYLGPTLSRLTMPYVNGMFKVGYTKVKMKRKNYPYKKPYKSCTFKFKVKCTEEEFESK